MIEISVCLWTPTIPFRFSEYYTLCLPFERGSGLKERNNVGHCCLSLHLSSGEWIETE